MGWTFIKSFTPRELINDRIQDWTDTRDGREIVATLLAYEVVGNCLWKAWEHRVTEADGVVRIDRWIGLDLLDFGRGGYKPMEESMGPYYYSCPLAYLDMAPVANANWREGVRRHHELNGSRLVLNDGRVLNVSYEPVA